MDAVDKAGQELDYPSVAAAISTAALVILMATTAGQFLVDHRALEGFVKDWLPFMTVFIEMLPDWAREQPFVLGCIAVAAIVTVRLLASSLPRMGIYLLTVAILCALLIVAPAPHVPESAGDWAFICYVTLAAFLGGAPRSYETPG